MTLKEAMRTLLEISLCEKCACKDCNGQRCKDENEEAIQLIKLYLAPAEPTMEK